MLLMLVLALVGAPSQAVEYNFAAQPHDQPYFVRESDQNVILPCAFNADLSTLSGTHWSVVSQESPHVLTHGRENYSPDLYDLDVGSCVGCYNLRIKSVKFDKHNGKFFCQVGGRNSAPAHVVVLVRPGFPSFANAPQYFTEGTTGRFDCESAGGNPAPRISWHFSNGTDVSRLARQTNATDQTKATVSQLQWMVDARDHNSKLTCKVWNEAMESKEPSMEITTAPLNVIYAPRVSIVPATPYRVVVGDTASFQCTAQSNPPVIRYSWIFNKNLLETKTSNLPLFAVSKSSAGNYSCLAENGEKTGVGSTYLDVLYPPEITSPAEFRSAVGRKVTLTCSVDSNPPPVSVTWTTPDGRTTEGAALDVESVSLHDAGNYTCTAKNLLTPSNGSMASAMISLSMHGLTPSGQQISNGPGPRTATKIVALVVDHAPGPSVVRMARKAEPVVTGHSLNLTCIANGPGSPAPHFRWRRPGDSDFAEYSSQNVLTLYDVKLTDAGSYSCVAYNVIGQGDAGSIDLVVYEPAHIEKHLNLEDTRSENETGFSLNCTVRGTPAPNITWYKGSQQIVDDSHWEITSNVVNQCRVGENCLFHVQGFLKWRDAVKWSDKGDISCATFNGAGPPAYSRTTLSVYHRPVVINDPSRPFVASDLGRTVDIVCKASSKPDPSFMWTRNHQPLPSTFDYSTTSRKNSSATDLHESTLTIKNLREQDMGDFECIATNRFGSGAFIFTVQAKSKPWAPQDFQSPVQTHRSILMSWRPGFNGGDDQTFLVEINYPDGSAPQTVALAENLTPPTNRAKRHAGVEMAQPLVLNVTSDVVPNAEYKFRIKAKNGLGETEWSPYVIAWSSDAPLNLDIQKITQALYHADTSTLEFQPTNLDSQNYCIMVYLRDHAPDSRYYYFHCGDPSSKMNQLPAAASTHDMKLRFCQRSTLECGPPFELLNDDHLSAAFSWQVLLGVLFAIVVLVALSASCCVVCRRCDRFKSIGKKCQKSVKKNSADNSYSKRNGGYESNSNPIRPKVISGPFLTEKTPGPAANGIGGAGKDGGVFTTPHGSLAMNYQYDPSPYADQGTRHFFENFSQRRSSSDAQTNQWADPPNGFNRAYVDTFDGYDPSMAVTVGGHANGGHANGGPFLSVAGADVDMRPDPSSHAAAAKVVGTGGTRDSGLSSTYSTPTQRRVIREIIV